MLAVLVPAKVGAWLARPLLSANTVFCVVPLHPSTSLATHPTATQIPIPLVSTVNGALAVGALRLSLTPLMVHAQNVLSALLVNTVLAVVVPAKVRVWPAVRASQTITVPRVVLLHPSTAKAPAHVVLPAEVPLPLKWNPR